MTAVPQLKLTPEDYLAIEREAETKSEFVDGEVFAMSGGSFNHDLIAGNLRTEVNLQFKGKPRKAFGSDVKVWLNPANTFAYPDFSALCGPLIPYDDKNDIYENPSVIAEVLSPSTESWDRGGKFHRYQTLESLREYLLIAQQEMRVDSYVRTGEAGVWSLRTLSGGDDLIELKSIEVTLKVADLYDRVEFEPSANSH
jgi:Uma2 family endonuclease